MTIQRDALGRSQKITLPYYISELSYDALDNLTTTTYQDSLGKQKLSYTFDDLDQLITEEEHTYQYDCLYNRVKKDTLAHQINTLCQITHDGQRPYTLRQFNF